MPPCKPRPILRLVLPLLLLAGGGVAWTGWRVSVHYEVFLKAQLPQWVEKASGGVYHIQVDRIRVGVLGRRITLTGLHLWPDSGRLAQLKAEGHGLRRLIDCRIPELQLRGAVWEDLVTNRVLRCRRVVLTAPQVTVLETPDTSGMPGASASNGAQGLQAFRAAHFDVVRLAFTYTSTRTGRAFMLNSRNGSAAIQELQFWPAAEGRPTRAAGRLQLTLGSTRYATPDRRFETSADSVGWLPQQKILRIAGLRLRPLRRVTDQRALVVLHIGTVTANGFSLRDLLQQHRLRLDSLALINPVVTTTVDRRLPRRPVPVAAPYPQDLYRRLPLAIQTPLVRLHDGSVRYEEWSRRTRRLGTIRFDGLTGSITGLDQQQQAVVQLTGRFQERSALAVTGSFELSDSNAARFSLAGSLRELKDYQIRNTALALSLVQLQGLNVTDARFRVEGDRRSTRAALTGHYEDLRVQILRADSTTGVLHRRGLASLFANRVVLHPSNPLPGEPLRAVQTALRRDSTLSFFGAIWGVLLQDIKQIVIADLSILERAQVKARTKPERLRERLQRRESRKARRAARRARKAVKS